jgi:hypothetical protein
MPSSAPPTINDALGYDLAAASRERIRVAGDLVCRTTGFRSRYRQALITVDTGAIRVQFTASLGGTLADLPPGTSVVVDLTLTGLVDLANGVYMGERARLVQSVRDPRSN